MLVSQAEIDAVHRGDRKQMMLPIERGEHGELLPCKVEIGQCVSLQPRQFVKGSKVTITNLEAITLADLSELHAKRQGYATLAELLEGWSSQHGTAELSVAVWLAHFVRNDESEFYRQHRERYLKAKGVGLTYEPDRAVRGEPAVTEDEQLAIARKARNDRVLIDRERAKEQRAIIKTALGELRGLELSEEVVDEIRRAEWRLKKLDGVLEKNVQQKAA